MNLGPEQWLIALLVALLVGVSKTGIGGLSMFAVVLMANVFPSAKQVSGLILPLLITGDVFAVLFYRRHAQWASLWRLFPPTAVGVLIGWWAMGRMADHTVARTIGVMVVSLVALQVYRQFGRPQSAEAQALPAWVAWTLGILAGFTTLMANAAGPLMAIYLLAMRLPKYEFVGTGAVFFMILNWFKVPFMVQLGLINVSSLQFNAVLLPAVIMGALAGRWILQRVNQRWFEILALALSGLAGLRLLLS